MTEKDLAQMIIPVYRLSEEVLLPAIEAAGLEIELAQRHIVKDYFWEQYKLKGDSRGYARALTNWLRSAMEPTILSAIKDSEKNQEIADRFYTHLENLLFERVEELEESWANMETLVIAVRKPYETENIEYSRSL